MKDMMLLSLFLTFLASCLADNQRFLSVFCYMASLWGILPNTAFSCITWRKQRGERGKDRERVHKDVSPSINSMMAVFAAYINFLCFYFTCIFTCVCTWTSVHAYRDRDVIEIVSPSFSTLFLKQFLSLNFALTDSTRLLSCKSPKLLLSLLP